MATSTAPYTSAKFAFPNSFEDRANRNIGTDEPERFQKFVKSKTKYEKSGWRKLIKFKTVQPGLVSWRDAIYFGNPVHSSLVFSHG